MSESAIPVYLLIKAIAYIGWCGQGSRIHGHQDRLLLRAFLYGVVRLTMGLVLGTFLIAVLVGALAEAIPHALLYFLVFIPIRWLEWSLMAVIIDLDRRTLNNFLVGDTSASRLWRIGGIVLSCVADLPLIVGSQGLPGAQGWC